MVLDPKLLLLLTKPDLRFSGPTKEDACLFARCCSLTPASPSDTLQVLVALVVTPEGFPVAYEVFDGDTADVTTLEEIVSKIESKYGMKGRVWVFDRGVVSEDNLQDLRQRGAYYLVGTPRRKLADFERELLEGDWQHIAGKPGVRVQLLFEGGETFVLARSLQQAKKESAMLRSQLVRLHRFLRALGRVVAGGRLKETSKIERRLGRLEERYPQGLVHAQRGRTSRWPAIVVLE
jgi:transposase